MPSARGHSLVPVAAKFIWVLTLFLEGLLEEEAQEKDHQYGIDRGAAHHGLRLGKQGSAT